MIKLYQDKEWLEQKYIEEKLSKSAIAKLCNIGNTTVLYWLKKSNIPRRSQSEALKGVVFSEEHIKNMSKSQKGHIPWNKNKTDVYSEKTIQRMSESNTKYGKENSHWKGGITPLQLLIRNSFKYRQWRSDIFTCDDFTCQICGQIGGRLHAHHIKSFSSILQFYEITTLEEALECEELWNINNGITFCKKCHKKIGLHKGIVKINETNN